MVRMGVGLCLCLFVYHYRHMVSNEEVARMNPALKFLPIPTPTTEMIVAGSIAVGLLLAMSVSPRPHGKNEDEEGQLR